MHGREHIHTNPIQIGRGKGRAPERAAAIRGGWCRLGGGDGD